MTDYRASRRGGNATPLKGKKGIRFGRNNKGGAAHESKALRLLLPFVIEYLALNLRC
jgi:hypothetical protein